MIKAWIEAMRLRTLPVSMAGVLGGTACALHAHGFSLLPFLICLLFAVIAQILSNFANEYYDYKNGLDRKGRDGFRRGVTEGDISPEAMKRAVFSLLIVDAAIGSSLIIWGGWWLIFVGIAVAIFALAYSTGPYPLSHHGLGDIAVIIFFGFVPVIFTEYVQIGILTIDSMTVFTSLAIGLMAVNVLIVNNYRDCDEDGEVGKRTTVVIFGRKKMALVYLIDGIVSSILLAMASSDAPFWVCAGWISYLAFHLILWNRLKSLRGKALNPVLMFTSLLMFAVTIYFLIIMTLPSTNMKPSDFPIL